MNKKNIFLILFFALILGGGIFQYKKIKSQESRIPPISYMEDMIIKDTYSFATSTNAKTAAAFMLIENQNDEKERLIAARSNVSEFTEIHENIIDPDDGTMMMRKIKGLDIPKQGKTFLKPAGYHIMFINLKQPFKIGDIFPLTLTFENTGEQIVNVTVVAPGTNPHNHH